MRPWDLKGSPFNIPSSYQIKQINIVLLWVDPLLIDSRAHSSGEGESLKDSSGSDPHRVSKHMRYPHKARFNLFYQKWLRQLSYQDKSSYSALTSFTSAADVPSGLPGAFQAALHGVLTATRYEQAVRDTMSCGGCTCSRGSFIGACLGAQVWLCANLTLVLVIIIAALPVSRFLKCAIWMFS